MKANGVPEKIWIDNLDEGFWFDSPSGNKSIEYIRKDAFIEKALSYLNSKLYDWVSITNPDQRSCANTIMKQDFIKDFKNYMKGE